MIAILLAAALVAFCIFTSWTCNFWRRRGIRGPRGVPLVGNMFQFCIGRKHYGEVYHAIYKAHPLLPYVGMYRVFNEPAILLRSLDMVKEVMVRSFQHFHDNVIWVDPRRDPITSCNPFVAAGEKWRDMRAEIVPIFSPNKVKASFPHIEATCSKLVDFVETHLSESFEAKNLFSKFTLDVVASAAFSLDAEAFTNTNSDFTLLVENLFQPHASSLLETIALLFSPRLGGLLRYHFVPPGVQQWLRTIVGAVLEKRLGGDATTAAPSDFIQWLLEAKRKSNEPVSVPTIVGHSGTFLLEGFETSSSLMAYTLFEYAAHAAVQSRVLQEIDDVLARHDRKLTYEALQEMTYLEATLFETLRMHSPMLALLKRCTKSFQLPPQVPGDEPHIVQKGTTFVIPVHAIHNDPELYPEPAVYSPERFCESSQKQKPGCAFLGFGEGPRMCPGMRFGLLQTKAGLAALLTKYSVHLSDPSRRRLDLVPTTFLTATKLGIWIKFKKRQSEMVPI